MLTRAHQVTSSCLLSEHALPVSKDSLCNISRPNQKATVVSTKKLYISLSLCKRDFRNSVVMFHASTTIAVLDYISPFIGTVLQSWDLKINNVAGRFILEMTSETHPEERDGCFLWTSDCIAHKCLIIHHS